MARLGLGGGEGGATLSVEHLEWIERMFQLASFGPFDRVGSTAEDRPSAAEPVAKAARERTGHGSDPAAIGEASCVVQRADHVVQMMDHFPASFSGSGSERAASISPIS